MDFRFIHKDGVEWGDGLSTWGAIQRTLGVQRSGALPELQNLTWEPCDRFFADDRRVAYASARVEFVDGSWIGTILKLRD